MDTLELVRWISTALFVLLAGVTATLAFRLRRPAAYWAFATFTALAAVAVSGRLAPDVPPLWFSKLTVVMLLAFPWALFRFATSFERLPGWARHVGDVLAAALVLWTLAVPDFPAPNEEPSSGFQVYVLAVVALWVGLSIVVAVELWRGGRGQPTLTRRRMRLLSLGATVMSVAIIGAAYAPSDESSVWPILIQLLAIVAALAFLVGFTPPPLIRAAWRQPEERELYTSSLKLMSPASREEVAAMILPHIARVAGGSAAWIVDADGAPLATHGEVPAAGTDGFTAPAGPATVHVWPSVYAPFFSEEELRLMRRLSLLTGLAFERADALDREREARRGLEAANDELESFVYSASHDLKSPLIALLGYIDVIRDEYGGHFDEQGHWYLERMLHNGSYMESLIGDLLELSRVGRVDTEITPVPLGEVARQVADELSDRYPAADIRIGSLPTIWFNAARARQLFTNLIENACRYGGRPDIRVDVLSYHTSDGGIAIAIADDGVGIPEQYRDRIFGVFERLGSEELAGTGIGLAICTKIAEVAGGRLELVPTERGARFVISLPSTVRVPDGAGKEARA